LFIVAACLVSLILADHFHTPPSDSEGVTVEANPPPEDPPEGWPCADFIIKSNILQASQQGYDMYTWTDCRLLLTRDDIGVGIRLTGRDVEAREWGRAEVQVTLRGCPIGDVVRSVTIKPAFYKRVRGTPGEPGMEAMLLGVLTAGLPRSPPPLRAGAYSLDIRLRLPPDIDLTTSGAYLEVQKHRRQPIINPARLDAPESITIPRLTR
jgi:hypothetical protein